MTREIKIKQGSKKVNGRTIEYHGMWLLYNFDSFISFHWTKKAAWSEAENLHAGETVLVKEIYQVIRGDIRIKIYE